MTSKYQKFYPEWIELYQQGLSIREIADRYKVNKGCVSYCIRNTIGIRPKNNHHLYEEEAIRLFQLGFNGQEIANQLNISFNVVKNILSKNGIHLGNKLKYEHLISHFIEDYEKGLSLREIGDKYNVSSQTVLNYLNYNQSKVRSYSESSLIYEIENTYFKDLNPEKIYFMGIIFGCGKIYEINTSQFINFSIDENKKELLEKILDEFSNKTNKSIFKKDKGKGYYARINSIAFVEELRELGINQHLPSLKDEDKIFFFKGFFDSSHSIFKQHIAIKCFPSYRQEIINFLNQIGIYHISENKYSLLIKKADMNTFIEFLNTPVNL